jgi:hypothetical protein
VLGAFGDVDRGNQRSRRVKKICVGMP